MEYKTISEMFLATTNEFSSKVLYSYKKNSEWIGIKGSDIRSTVKNLSAGLRSIGVEAGEKAAILSTNSPEWAMSDYGIICNGSVTVTVYVPEHRPEIELESLETLLFPVLQSKVKGAMPQSATAVMLSSQLH